jgi:RNA polymerase sigma-70 factor, ECF subfamily
MQTLSSLPLPRPPHGPAPLPELDGLSMALVDAQIERHARLFTAIANARKLAEAKWNDAIALEVPEAATQNTDEVTAHSDSSDADAALVRAAWQGDPRAHVAIWRKYSPLVRSRIGRSVGGQDVEDHVQEVFLRLFEHLPQLRDPGALRSFIIGIALRVGGTELRRRRCRWWLAVTPTGELPEPAPSRDDGSDVREVLGTLLSILGKLTPHSSRVFELRYIEEKELTDVAKVMKISLATAKRHLARASTCFFAMAEREPALADFMRSGLWRSPRADLAASMT